MDTHQVHRRVKIMVKFVELWVIELSCIGGTWDKNICGWLEQLWLRYRKQTVRFLCSGVKCFSGIEASLIAAIVVDFLYRFRAIKIICIGGQFRGDSKCNLKGRKSSMKEEPLEDKPHSICFFINSPRLSVFWEYLVSSESALKLRQSFIFIRALHPTSSSFAWTNRQPGRWPRGSLTEV